MPSDTIRTLPKINSGNSFFLILLFSEKFNIALDKKYSIKYRFNVEVPDITQVAKN